jgi:hypothetical protein
MAARRNSAWQESWGEPKSKPSPHFPLQCLILAVRTKKEQCQPPYRCPGLQSAYVQTAAKPNSRIRKYVSGETLVRPFTQFRRFRGILPAKRPYKIFHAQPHPQLSAMPPFPMQPLSPKSDHRALPVPHRWRKVCNRPWGGSGNSQGLAPPLPLRLSPPRLALLGPVQISVSDRWRHWWPVLAQ